MDEQRFRWAWSTTRGDVRLTVTFESGVDSAAQPVSVSVERIDGGRIRTTDLVEAAESLESHRDREGTVQSLGILDEYALSRARFDATRDKRTLTESDLYWATAEDRAFIESEGLTIEVHSGPPMEMVQREVRMSRPRKRVRLTDEVLQDVAETVRSNPSDWVDILMERYGWASRENAWRVKGLAVKKGFLPPVEDGRGRTTGGAK